MNDSIGAIFSWWCVGSLAALAGVFAPAVAQMANEVQAVQVGMKLEIRYGLDAPAVVSVWLSEDSGTTWTELTTCLSGDHGKVETAGRKVAVWDVLSCRESLVGDGVRFKVLTGAFGPCAGDKLITFDGYDYRTVAIGNQCWFAENLRSDNYRSGRAIPYCPEDFLWGSSTVGVQSYYDSSLEYLFAYGRLYNWYSVSHLDGLCPSGWRVPSDADWTVLTDELGGVKVAGKRMKIDDWGGNNSSSFSATPGGNRDGKSGEFDNFGYGGSWWSSTSEGPDAWYRSLNSSSTIVNRSRYSKLSGFSVRCVRD
jgi:uncharacterized protein (TIGR02145 family)